MWQVIETTGPNKRNKMKATLRIREGAIHNAFHNLRQTLLSNTHEPT